MSKFSNMSHSDLVNMRDNSNNFEDSNGAKNELDRRDNKMPPLPPMKDRFYTNEYILSCVVFIFILLYFIYNFLLHINWQNGIKLFLYISVFFGIIFLLKKLYLFLAGTNIGRIFSTVLLSIAVIYFVYQWNDVSSPSPINIKEQHKTK